MSAKLYHIKGWGSVAAMAALKALDIPFTVVQFERDKWVEGGYADSAEVEEFTKANPLTQFPTLVTAEGAVLTEIAAIFLYLESQYAKGTSWDSSTLSISQRAACLRWLIFIPANLYSLITIQDYPGRFIDVPESAVCTTEAVHGWIIMKTAERQKEAYTILEEFLAKAFPRKAGQFILGTDEPTFLDLFIAVVAHYAPHPGAEWLNAACPNLAAVVELTVNQPSVREVFATNDLSSWIKN